MTNFPTPRFLPFPDGCLRPLRATEEEVTRSWCGINNIENLVYLMRRFPQSYGDQMAWFEKPSNEKNIVLAIEYENVAIGTMGVHDIDMINRVATTGAVIWDQQHWNLGIGSRAKMVLLNYCFTVLNLRIIYSRVISFNQRSARYSDKCGYKQEAVLKDRFQFGDRFADELILSVTREGFKEPWEAFRAEHQIESFDEMLDRHKTINR